MNKKLIAIIVGVVVVIGLATIVFALSQPKATENTTTETTQEDTSGVSSGVPVEPLVITYTDAGFVPMALTIKADSTLRVINKSKTVLEFSSDDHPTHREDPELNMAALKPGEEGSVKVTKTGTHSFHNHVKAADVGTLTVTE